MFLHTDKMYTYDETPAQIKGKIKDCFRFD